MIWYCMQYINLLSLSGIVIGKNDLFKFACLMFRDTMDVIIIRLMYLQYKNWFVRKGVFCHYNVI